MDSGFNDNDADSFGWNVTQPGEVNALEGGVVGINGDGAPLAGASSMADPSQDSFDRGGIVGARGTGEGLVLRMDGRVDPISLRRALNDFMESRRAFLSGQEVLLEWVGAIPAPELVQEFMATLTGQYGVTVKASRILERRQLVPVTSVEQSMPRAGGAFAATPINKPHQKNVFKGPEETLMSERPTSLFDGVHAMGREISPGAAPVTGSGQADPMLWDDPDTRMVYATLRSGQKIESEHSVVVFGDVNSGAEVIAGGDIVVLGTLRGVAHAGAYDETGGGRMIFALNLQPTQLRIGMVISRGSPEGATRTQPEVARVDGSLIVVEPYNAKGAGLKRGLRNNGSW